MSIDGNGHINVVDLADAFAAIFRHDMEPPELMIWADPPGRESGTWVFRRGHEPYRIADTSEFERIWMSTIGITDVSIKRFA